VNRVVYRSTRGLVMYLAQHEPDTLWTQDPARAHAFPSTDFAELVAERLRASLLSGGVVAVEGTHEDPEGVAA
jgi:hypothetical protein